MKFAQFNRIEDEGNRPIAGSVIPQEQVARAAEDEVQQPAAQQMEYYATTAPMAVNPAKVREFYARRDGRPGTRITMEGGAGLIVTETFEAVAAAFAALN